MSIRLVCLLSFALVVLTGGCAKSHDVEGVDGGGQSGEGGAGQGGSGGSGGTGGGAPMCDVTQCEPGSSALPIQIDACCTDTDLCGLNAPFGGLGCQQRDAPGPLDPSCPDQMMMGFSAKGCCTAAGACGVKDTFIGFGCIDFMGSGEACGGAGGAGGAGGNAGNGGAGGAGGGGGNSCTNCPALGFAAGMVGATKCCTTSDQCGVNIQGNCLLQDAPGEPSADCPDVTLMGFPLTGCCRPNGMCGADDGGFIGLGCFAAPGSTGTCTFSGAP